jgi:hypothetical protein
MTRKHGRRGQRHPAALGRLLDACYVILDPHTRGELVWPSPTDGQPSDLRCHRTLVALTVATTHRQTLLSLSPCQLHYQHLQPARTVVAPDGALPPLPLGRSAALSPGVCPLPTVSSWERGDGKSRLWGHRSLA